MSTNFPFRTRVLEVTQPLDSYYVGVIPADVLLQVAFSDRLRARQDDHQGYKVDGTQRAKSNARQSQIEDYIKRSDSAFPNTIILAANYDQETGHIRTAEAPTDADHNWDEKSLWTIEEDECGTILVIPSPEKLAGIIDGQHRLDGFRNINDPQLRTMPLVCSIFMGLSKPYQAQLFATINSTQKQVDKSLTYELFGYNIDEEPEERWTPDKLAVFLTRRLNTDPSSKLLGHISIAPQQDHTLNNLTANKSWRVSTATVVEGIMRLISSNPKKDANMMLTHASNTRELLKEGRKDKSPLRDIYIQGNDELLYKTVLNYIEACHETFWSNAPETSFIFKTVGIQALFDILRLISPAALKEKDISKKYFNSILKKASTIDFSGADFKNASGSGRSYIRKSIEEAIFVPINKEMPVLSN